MGRYSVPLAPLFADLAGVVAGQQVLDVGCGPGALTAELVRRLGPAAVSAVDPSEPFVAAAQERQPGVTVRRAAAEQLPFADGAFDAALAQLVVHFMADPVAGLGEMGRVTRRGGCGGGVCLGSRGRQGATRRCSGKPRASSSLMSTMRPGWRGPAKVTWRSCAGRRGCARSRRARCRSVWCIGASRSGGSRTRSASVPRALIRLVSTRRAEPCFASGAGSLLPAAPFTLTARAWAVRGLV